jgi:hypothetical protein
MVEDPKPAGQYVPSPYGSLLLFRLDPRLRELPLDESSYGSLYGSLSDVSGVSIGSRSRVRVGVAGLVVFRVVWGVVLRMTGLGLGLITGGTTTLGAVVVIGGNVVGELGTVAVVLGGGVTVVLGGGVGVVVGVSTLEPNVVVAGMLTSGASSLPPKTASRRIPTRITAPASTQASFRLACLVAESSGRGGSAMAMGGLGIGGSFGINVVACSPSDGGSGGGGGDGTAPGAGPSVDGGAVAGAGPSTEAGAVAGSGPSIGTGAASGVCSSVDGDVAPGAWPLVGADAPGA